LSIRYLANCEAGPGRQLPSAKVSYGSISVGRDRQKTAKSSHSWMAVFIQSLAFGASAKGSTTTCDEIQLAAQDPKPNQHNGFW
jgi:hypothetical protein